MMKAMLQKLHTEQGMSIGEALATVLIMSFVTIGIATGVTSGVRVYHEVTVRAEEQTLLATNVAALSQYLENGHNIDASESNKITVGYSEVSGTKVIIQNRERGTEEKGIYVQYYDENGAEAGAMQPLISTKSNTSGLYAQISAVRDDTKAEDKGQSEINRVTEFTVTIFNKNDKETKESETVKIRNTIQYPNDDLETVQPSESNK